VARCDTERCGRAVNASVYRSKLDSWLLLIFAGAGLVGCYAAWRVAHMPGFAGLLFGLVVLSLAVVLPAWTVRSTHYTLTDDALLVRSGLLSWCIKLHDITQILPTRAARSSPALSLDRLRIEYDRGRSLMISPLEQAKFLRDFSARYARQRAPR
jgi:hypothetical protein